MKKLTNIILSFAILSSALFFCTDNPLIVKAEENNIQSFINETVELIKENDDDKYYDTRDFSEIIFANKDNYIGSCEYRDAFKGSTTFTVNNPARYLGSAIDSINNSASIDLERPMGKFKFVSTDVDKFIDNLAETMKKQGLLQTQKISL